MNEVQSHIVTEITNVLSKLGVQNIAPQLSYPKPEEHGDYSTNIAMIVAKQLGKNPLELAVKIREGLSKSEYIKKVEVVQPGFINFWLSDNKLVGEIKNVLLNKERFGTNTLYSGKKVMVEFADPNPFKQIHIGHLRNLCLGECLSRMYEALGAEVWRVNYQGDVGMHVAKCLYGLMGLIIDENKTLGEKIQILADAYAKGATAYETNEQAKKEIQDINTKVYAKDPTVIEMWEKGRKWSLDYFETVYARLGTKYKRYYFESQAEGPGKAIVMSHIDDGIFEKDQGAVVFRGEKYGLHTRVFIANQGYATYEAKDLALAQIKYGEFPYDVSIIMTGAEQSAYFDVILKAISLVHPDLGPKTTHYSFGMVQLSDRKMSSRTGDVITAEWLLDEAYKKTKTLFPATDPTTAGIVATGAVKYSMLSYARDSDINFSFEQSLSLEGNSGPYLQYAYARIQSVLSKSGDISMVQQASASLDSANVEGVFNDVLSEARILEPQEVAVLRTIHRFPGMVADAGIKFAPHVLCGYLFDLAQKFNAFYEKFPILESDEKDFRLSLALATGQVLKNGLYLLGIDAPERI